MYPSLNAKVVVVTGAGSGIGRAIAERFAEQGATVVVNDVDADTASETVDAIGAAGGTASSAIADVSDGGQVAEMFDQIIGRHDTVDVLVNNAGLVSPMLHFLSLIHI